MSTLEFYSIFVPCAVSLLALACHEARVFYRFMRGPRVEDSEDHFDVYERLSALLRLVEACMCHPLKYRPAPTYTAILNSVGGLKHTRKLTPSQTKMAKLIIQKVLMGFANERH